MLFNLYIYLYSVSYTGVLATTALILIWGYLHMRPSLTKAENMGINLIFPMILALSFIPFQVLQGETFEKWDRILNNRLGYPRYYFASEPITLFGTRLQPAPSDNYYLDNAFQYAFLQLGVVTFLMVCLFFFVQIEHARKHQALSELSLLLGYVIIGFSDPFLFNTGYKNVGFVFLGALFYRMAERAQKRMPMVLQKQIALFPKTGEERYKPKGILEWMTGAFWRMEETYRRKRTSALLLAAAAFVITYYIGAIDDGAILSPINRDYQILRSLSSDIYDATQESRTAGVHFRSSISAMITAMVLYVEGCAFLRRDKKKESFFIEE